MGDPDRFSSVFQFIDKQNDEVPKIGVPLKLTVQRWLRGGIEIKLVVHAGSIDRPTPRLSVLISSVALGARYQSWNPERPLQTADPDLGPWGC